MCINTGGVFHPARVNLARAAILLFLGALGGVANGQTFKVAEGVAIYLGIVPAEVVRGHPAEHPEGSMHRGAPPGPGQYHVMVALFDAKSGQRITDSPVIARVSSTGGGTRVEKTLEPMNIADSITYGNFFPMPDPGPYKIAILIYRPGLSHVIEAEFEHKHF